MPTLLQLCDALAEGGAGEAATPHPGGDRERQHRAGSLLTASLTRDQAAIRTGAAHRGLSPDLVWLVAELAVSPFVHALQRLLFGDAGERTRCSRRSTRWNHGYCPACGSWPALAEVVGGHRTLRCSFCASAWELTTYACIYCEESGEPFVTAAPDEERKDRRLEVCSALRRLPEDRSTCRSCRRSRCWRSPTSKRSTSTWRRWSTATRGPRARRSFAVTTETAELNVVNRDR